MISHDYKLMADGTYSVGYFRPGRVEDEFVLVAINFPSRADAIREVERLNRQPEPVDDRFRIVCEVVE